VYYSYNGFSKYEIMSINLEYSNQQSILTVSVQGYLTLDHVEGAILDILESNEFYHDVNTVWDIRGMHFDNIDMMFLKQVIEVQKKYAERRGGAKIAIISNYALAAPIVKLYMILSKNLRQKYSAFSSVDEAEHWLSKEVH